MYYLIGVQDSRLLFILYRQKNIWNEHFTTFSKKNNNTLYLDENYFFLNKLVCRPSTSLLEQRSFYLYYYCSYIKLYYGWQDTMLSQAYIVEYGNCNSRELVVRWLRQFPFSFISDREYVIARKTFKEGDVSYSITKVKGIRQNKCFTLYRNLSILQFGLNSKRWVLS